MFFKRKNINDKLIKSQKEFINSLIEENKKLIEKNKEIENQIAEIIEDFTKSLSDIDKNNMLNKTNITKDELEKYVANLIFMTQNNNKSGILN